MRTAPLQQETIDRAVAFHRSLCPGLATGIKAAQIAIAELGEQPEDLVALVESDICGVDGVQAVTGCTLGNRNLVYRDWGKNAYTFWRRSDGKAIRVSGAPIWDPMYQDIRGKVHTGWASFIETVIFTDLNRTQAQHVLDADPYELFHVACVSSPVPQTSSVDTWVTCARCHEQVMETRTRQLGGVAVCVPCSEAAQAAA